LPEAYIVVVPKPTSGPAETVKIAINDIKMIKKDDFQFLVKDCDSFFDHEPVAGNYICASNIADHETLNRLASKSFVKYNDQNIITDIIEKKVVSDSFCVGGYKFESAEDYLDAYEDLKDKEGELFVSHIIQYLMNDGCIFKKVPVTNYVDVGTADDWHKYNDMPVIFCDIDGTLIKAQSRYGDNRYGTDPEILTENFNRIKEYHDKGCQIFFTTARPDEYHDQTRAMLNKMGFSNGCLLSGLHNSKRILINDYNKSNPYPRAEAINIQRDNDNLRDFL
jgi:hypothetical protein